MMNRTDDAEAILGALERNWALLGTTPKELSSLYLTTKAWYVLYTYWSEIPFWSKEKLDSIPIERHFDDQKGMRLTYKGVKIVSIKDDA